MKFYLFYLEDMNGRNVICNTYREDVHGDDIPKPHIIIEDEKLFNRIVEKPSSWFVIDDKELILVKPTPFYHIWDKEILEWLIDKDLKKAYDLKQLDDQYNPILDELANSYNRALLFEEMDTSKEIQEEAQRMLKEYIDKKKQIEEGNELEKFTYDRKFCHRCGTKLVKHKCPKCGWHE